MKRSKVCVFTGARSEYGLLRWLMEDIKNDNQLELQLVVTGMHLSPEFGNTEQEMLTDGFKVDERIETLLSSDSAIGVGKSMGLVSIGLSEAFERLRPDLLIGMGDRFELFAAVGAAVVRNIRVAHLNGGEITEGAIDNQFRHAITKMSNIHFTANPLFRRRVIQMGEPPENVISVGEAGLDNVHRLPLFNKKDDLAKALNFPLEDRTLLVTYHPETATKGSSKVQINTILSALEEFVLAGWSIIFTRPNADVAGRAIASAVDKFVAKYPENTRQFSSLGQKRYLSALKFCDAVVGNSSSGLVEAPAFGRAAVNIGDRQKGRVAGANVISVSCEKDQIVFGIKKALTPDFRELLQNMENPYGDGFASERIKNHIKEYLEIRGRPQGKKFFDLPIEL